MDPVTLVVTALTSGATIGGQAVINTAFEQAYESVKTLVQQKLAGKPRAETLLADFEDDPETYEKPLRKVLIQECIDQDEAIIEKAQKLMELIQPHQSAAGKFNVHIAGNVQGNITGDYQNVTLNFSGESSKK